MSTFTIATVIVDAKTLTVATATVSVDVVTNGRVDTNGCYNALRPYIDSEINHIRHFIKIQFVNKGIEFINLPSIFKDKFVSIPTYFENKESPIICYKYD